MKTRTMILCALFAALTAVGAFFKIPFALAAISLQFLFTAMAGVLLGAGYGALSQAADSVRVRDRQAGKKTADFLAHGAFDARRSCRSVCHRRSVYGADCKRLSWKGTERLADSVQGHADLPAG